MAQEDSRQEGRRAERWARVNFPNKFVHPHDFRPGEPVRLFRGVGPERRTLEISNPWDLCRAVKAHNDEYARSRQEAAAMSAEASQARGAAGGADEFDTFGEPADVQDGYLPGDPADPTTMLDPSSGMGATL